jgi:WD40 repeat protein
MRVRISLIRATALLATAPWLATAQPSPVFSRPVLGYVFDDPSQSVKVIAGIPGAASLETAFEWGQGQLSISPRNTFGLSSGKGLSVTDWTSGKPMLRSLNGEEESPSQIAFSPSGKTVIALFRSSGKLRIWTGLPALGTLESDVDVSVSDGTIAMAVADDGRTAALLVEGKLLRVGPGGTLLPVDSEATYSAMAFQPGTRELAVTDPASDRVLLFGDFANGSAASTIAANAASPAAVSFSADGKKLIVATHGTESILMVDMETRNSVVLECACQPEGFYPASGNAVFRLSESAKGNLVLFDGDGEAPRIVLVAAPSTGGAQ